MAEPWDLGRFVVAQDPIIDRALAELRAGRKRSHWMWFVFPQLRDLGRSVTARRYGIASPDEARAYSAHPVLGPRLMQSAAVVLGVSGRSAHDIFGSPDDLKLRSSMTLFAAAAPHVAIFGQVLAKYYGGAPDPRTVELLAEMPDSADP